MERKQKFKLVEGIFNPSRANKLLLDLFNYKIEYHKEEIKKYESDASVNLKHSQKRIDALIATRNEIKRYIQQANDNALRIILKGDIEVALTE